MKKVLSITGILLLMLVMLIGISALIMSRYIDPNKFKGKISQYVYAKTGQVLVINGNMQWSFFPWIGLKANNLTYYNAPSFTPKTFISAKEMDIKIKLIPLITGKIEVGNVTLDHALLNLIKNKSGQYNWQTLAKDHSSNQIAEKNGKTSKAISKLTIESLKIKNSKLKWYDEQKNSHTTISDLDISSKDIQFGQAFPLSLQFNLLGDKNVKNLSLDARTDLSLSPNYQNYKLENIRLKGNYFTPQKTTLNLKVQGYLTGDIKSQTLDSKLNLVLENINAEINLSGKNINSKPQIYGNISTDEFNLKDLLNSMGIPFNTKNSKSLKSITLISKINLGDNALQLSNLHASVDQTELYGNISVIPSKQQTQFNLTANNIDLNDYLSDDSENSQNKNGETKGISGKNKIATDSHSSWNINGNIKIANLKMDKLKLSHVSATVNKKNNIINVSPFHATAYKGGMAGTITVDKQPNRTAVYIKQSIKNVNIKELLHEFSDTDKLSGSTNLTADLVSVMNNKTSFLSALNGKLQFSLTNGSLHGVDVIYQLSRAHAFIKHLSTSGLSDSKQTEFSALTADGVVNNGIINVNDLALSSSYLKVNGKGTTNLMTKDIHYRLNALAQPKLATENNKIGKEVTIYQVPIKVSGKLNKPSVNVDFVELAKVFLAKEIQKPVSEHIGKNINHLKDSLKEKVNEKLKSITPTSVFNKLTHSKSADTSNAEK